MQTLQDLTTKNYSDLTKEDWDLLQSQGIVNGFWPASHPVLGWILDRIWPAFQESSPNIHDFTYWQGGDEARRKECDEGFLLRLVSDSIKTGWKMPYYYTLSLAYFVAVRIFGSRYFKYK